MNQATILRWETMKTDETRAVEAMLRDEFPKVDAYRFNSASIRVRVVDPRFEGLSFEQRDAMVEPHLNRLPDETLSDIMNLLTLSPDEFAGSSWRSRLNLEFEDPSPSML